jgi:hypothetical protein
MNKQFDELTRSMAQSVTRRAALKKFGVAVLGMAVAYLSFVNKAEAGHCKPGGSLCNDNSECCTGYCLPDSFGKKNGHGFSTCTYSP